MALLTLQTIVDKAARRCGHLAEQLTTEQTQFMRENLGLILSHESNTGLNLWKVNKYRHGINNGQVVYTLPSDCETILDINYVTGDLQTLTPTGTYNWPTTASTTNCQAVGIKFASALPTATIKLQYSTDKTNWVDVVSFTPVAGWNYPAVSVQPEGAYWRLAAFSAGITPGSLQPLLFPAYLAINFYSLISEIPMAPLNRDDYWNLPNKEFQSNRPLQYWFDRQNTQSLNLGTLGPQIRYWPVGNDETVNVNMLYGARISDPTTLKYDQYIDVPERWMHYVIAALAADSAMELPNVPLDRVGKLEQIRDSLRLEVYNGETDDAPIYWGPNISYYTR